MLACVDAVGTLQLRTSHTCFQCVPDTGLAAGDPQTPHPSDPRDVIRTSFLDPPQDLM